MRQRQHLELYAITAVYTFALLFCSKFDMSGIGADMESYTAYVSAEPTVAEEAVWKSVNLANSFLSSGSVEANTDKVVTVTEDEAYDSVSNSLEFTFPENVSQEAQIYLNEVYAQAHEASRDTAFPDPFMAMALSVVENPVQSHEIYRLPLISQDLFDEVLLDGTYKYSKALEYSDVATPFGTSGCVGPLQFAVEYIDTVQYNPTIWRDSCKLFYASAEGDVHGITAFAEKCDMPVDDIFLYTVISMRHNVGNLSDWANADPDTPTNRDFIPYISKRAVYEWNASVASDTAQEAIKQAAYESYLNYCDTGIYVNSGIDWKEIAELTGYDQNKLLPDYQWWRPLYNVRFWHNYYLLKMLYGVM